MEEIWNDTPIRNLRKSFLAGEKPTRCSECYSREEILGESYRTGMNKRYSAEFDRIDRTDAGGALIDGEILSLDLRLSNMCNFKCRSCGPQNSVAWYGDAEKISKKQLMGTKRATETAEQFGEMFDRMLPNLRAIYFAGGEPLMEDMHYRLLEKLIELGRTDISLDYNSNFSTLKWKAWDAVTLWRHFQSVAIGASLDGVRSQGELLRKGMKWKETVENFHRLRSESPHIRFFVYMTISALNAFHAPQAIKHFLELGMIQKPSDLELNIATSPRYINLGLLNDHERELLRLNYESFIANELTCLPPAHSKKIESDLRMVLQSIGEKHLAEERKHFRRYTIGLDRLRGEHFHTLFPEYFELLYSIS